MNGTEASVEAQKPPPNPDSNEANGVGQDAKKRKKETLKPIITTESASQPSQSPGYVMSFLYFCSFIPILLILVPPP